MDKTNSKSSFKERGMQILPQSLFLVITFGIFMPCSLFLGNIDEFAVDFVAIVPIVIAVSVFVFAVIGVLSFCLRPKILFSVFCMLVFSAALGFYLQGNFLNPKLSVLNGTAIDWAQYRVYGVASLLVWGLCVIVPQIALWKKPVITKAIVKWGSLFLSGVQILTLLVLIATTTKAVDTDLVVTKNHEFDLSTDQNTVVFVVDTMDAAWFEEFILSKEENKKQLKDFTYFDNAVAGGAPTILGIPTMLTGETFDTKESIEDYKKKAYEKSDLFRDLKKAGCQVNLFTTYSYLNGADVENIDNLESGYSYKISSYPAFSQYLYRLVSFYAMPQFLKQSFWFYSGDFSNLVTVTKNDVDMYEIDDPQFYEDMMKNGVKANQKEKVFSFYHFFGVHGPYTMNEKCERIEETSSIEAQKAQLQGAFRIIFDYIEQMKQEGQYENSTVIITADHGGKELYQNPAILIKKPGTMDALSVNSSEVTFRNLRSSIASSLLEDHSKYGENLFEVTDKDIPRLHTAAQVLGEAIFPDNEAVFARDYTQYVIQGNARDLNNVKIFDESLENKIKLKVGETLDLQSKAGNQITNGVITGDESEGMWVLGNVLNLEIELENDRGKDLTMDLAYSATVDNKQTVDASAGDQSLGSFSCKEGGGSLLLAIPAKSVNNHKLSLTLRFPNAVIRDERDGKKLSINMSSICITEGD